MQDPSTDPIFTAEEIEAIEIMEEDEDEEVARFNLGQKTFERRAWNFLTGMGMGTVAVYIYARWIIPVLSSNALTEPDLLDFPLAAALCVYSAGFVWMFLNLNTILNRSWFFGGIFVLAGLWGQMCVLAIFLIGAVFFLVALLGVVGDWLAS
ncbi:hypothetical protein [Planctomicrobium piriforme]|uniref:Uncharacterized protein n=1 Tax=Planctomicrobium piriforme TaxID=1576369 RepID=A0A1I3DK98_9PLAN|nr:hypothetical protein [Planctomicrobium piriforme]SFH87116.1 hypothetical protein SAMN05421753_103288 [Planctomicrobium piriforme]